MRTIFHSDLNNFYASVECLLRPELRSFPLVVCGSIENRHGIVLAKNMLAKKAGITTGMVLYEAFALCPNLKTCEVRMAEYIKYARKVREIYAEYTDFIEPFGIDEAWLDVTSTVKLYRSAEDLAFIIKERIKSELGLTVSIGVSFNKVFAKLGSDMKKPDAITVINEDNFKEKIWVLPASELLYVGKQTFEKLKKLNINTIGDIARSDKSFLISHLGKWGDVLHDYACGMDFAPVRKYTEDSEIKSVGNSITFYRDLTNNSDVESLLFVIAESVASRMRDYGFKKARSISLTIMSNNLNSTIRMAKMNPPTALCSSIASHAYELFLKNWEWATLVRGLGISVSDFTDEQQLDISGVVQKEERKENLEIAVEKIRDRFGSKSVKRGIVMVDKKMGEIVIKDEHTIHPVCYKKPK
ncbi:MAG: DNA polymerase IV [Clostridia bacterium]